MMDLDIVNVLNHLYFQPQLSDARAQQVLYCYHDTRSYLEALRVIEVNNGQWSLAPGIVPFLKMADLTISNFPVRNWIFGGPLGDAFAELLPAAFCFLAIPYGPAWFPAVRHAVEQAARSAGYQFSVAMDFSQPGNSMSQVWTEIRSARVVVADLTGLNANVFYELWLSHALGKPAILITQEPQKLPFDVRGMRWHAYSAADLGKLSAVLRSSLDAVRAEIAPKQT